MTLTLDELRCAGLWAAECATRVLPLFEVHAPADARPRAAIEGIIEFARGGKRTARLRTLAMAAHAAARDSVDPATTAAARSAGFAAAVAYMHPIADEHQSKHLLGPAVYAALARELSMKAGHAVADAEIQQAIGRAPPTVREVVRRYPARSRGRSRLDALYHQIDAALR